MKTKKQIWTILLFLVSILANFGFALSLGSLGWQNYTLETEEIYDLVSCTSVAKIYLNEDNNNNLIDDSFFYLNSNFRLTGTVENHTAGQIVRDGNTPTTVKYYTPLPNMLYSLDAANKIGPIGNETFWRASRVFPYNTPVRGIATTPNKVVFERPLDNDPNKNIISIVYNYKYLYANGFNGSKTSLYWYNSLTSMNNLTNSDVTLKTLLPGPEGNRKRSWSTIKTLDVCRNYELNRCGDGKTDSYDSSRANTFTGEICDDGPNNGQPGYCDINCGVGGGDLPRCGDAIIQEPLTTPYIDPVTLDPNGMSFEECDDGDETTNPGGLINGIDITSSFCSLICLPNFAEEFTEEFVNE